MKVGILTFHHTTNYGATLQTYALWEMLRQHGYQVEIIDYRPNVAVKHYRNKIIQPIKSKTKRAFLKNFLKYSIPGLVKYFKMHSFLRSNMKLSRKVTVREELSKLAELNAYDVVICGSDQIWCIDSIRGFDPSYFLSFLGTNTRCRKISYAASFGPTSSLREHSVAIYQLVNQFDAISVRDSNSLQLIQPNCEKPVVKVLDPTFLLDFGAVFNLAAKPKQEYLLLYLEGNLSHDEIDFIKAIARERDLKIISIGEPCAVADQNFMSASPIEWLSHFNNASYIITNLYHGTIFSIKFKKAFSALARSSKMNKTNDLLEAIGLQDRLIVKIEDQSVDRHLLNIDYASIEERIEEEISKSREYLFAALSKQHGEDRKKSAEPIHESTQENFA